MHKVSINSKHKWAWMCSLVGTAGSYQASVREKLIQAGAVPKEGKTSVVLKDKNVKTFKM